VTDLCLFEFTLDSFHISTLGHALCQMGEEGIPLVLAYSSGTSQGLAARLVVPRLFEGPVRDRLNEKIYSGGEAVGSRVLPVEVVFFYGPHFGERYGIAEAALRALEGGGIHTTAAACSVSCVYLVLPEGQSEEAVRALSETFEVPRAFSRKSGG
jgi:aspartokinase